MASPVTDVGVNGITRETIPRSDVAERVRNLADATVMLLPTAIPDDWTVELSTYNGGYSLLYTDPASTSTVSLEIAIPNPPSGARSTGGTEAFRGDPRALFLALDATDPGTFRAMVWREPGSWTAAPGGGTVGPQPGIPYYLTSTGISEGDFQGIATTLRPA